MDKPIGRSFNLRTRKSLKSIGQSVCKSCKRKYFPEDFSEHSDTKGDQSLCCDCESKKLIEPPAKRRQTRKAMATATIKPEPVESSSISNGQPNVIQTIPTNEKKSPRNNLDSDNMVKIHFTELLTKQPDISKGKSIFDQSFCMVSKYSDSIFFVHIAPKRVKSVPANVKKEDAKLQRILRNKTNTMQTIDQLDNPNDVPGGLTVVPREDIVDMAKTNIITKKDTVDSLRQKFPKVNLFEFEFLMFLKANTFD